MFFVISLLFISHFSKLLKRNVMIDVSVCQFVNQVDNSQFTLYTEWEDTYFKIILLKSSTVPLSGEMHTENATYFLDHLGESFDTYLEKTKHAFSGKNADIHFFFQNDVLTWKQQNILTRGEITVYPLSNILIISDNLKQLSELYQKCQEQILTLKKENEYLNKTNTKLVTDIKEMINIKNAMEKDLYTKFLLLLNTKKKRIRELQEALNNNKQIEKTVYDEITDESEGSDANNKKVHDSNAKKSFNIRKRKLDYKSQLKTTPNSKKEIFKRHTNSSSSESASPEPSTSKGKLTLQNTDVYGPMKSKRIFNSSEESEEDLFSE